MSERVQAARRLVQPARSLPASAAASNRPASPCRALRPPVPDQIQLQHRHQCFSPTARRRRAASVIFADRRRAVSRTGISRRAASTAARSAGRQCDVACRAGAGTRLRSAATAPRGPASGVLRRLRGAAPTAATWCCRICRSCSRPSASWTRLMMRSARGARRRAALVGDLERVAQLLRGDADLVQPLAARRSAPRPRSRVRGGVPAGRSARPARRARRGPAPAPAAPAAPLASRRPSLADVDVIEPRRASPRGAAHAPRSPARALRPAPPRGTVGRSASSSMRCSVTSSSRTVPSACVSRRILRCAFPALVCCSPSVSTGSASRRRREATRAWCTPVSLPAMAAVSCRSQRACAAFE